MADNQLIMPVGLPRAGKTTWAQQQGLPIVSPDSIRLALTGRPFVKEAEPFVWAQTKLMVRALFLAGHDKVILDATNLNKTRRDEWVDPMWVRRFRIFNTTRQVCLARAKAGERFDLMDVIEDMYIKAEPVTPLEFSKAEFNAGDNFVGYSGD